MIHFCLMCLLLLVGLVLIQHEAEATWKKLNEDYSGSDYGEHGGEKGCLFYINDFSFGNL